MAESKSTITKPSNVVDEFTELYCKIIVKLYGQKSRQFLNNVKRALTDVRQLKHDIGKWNDKTFFAEVHFKKAETRCAYTYAYCLLNTAIVYTEFFKCLQQKEKEFREVFSKKTLNICCLAGGPATEALAISKAINDFLGKFSSDVAQLFSDVHVTVVDICPDWSSEADAVVSALNDTAGIFLSRKVSVQADFLVADLLKPFEESLQDNIKEANIVTVVKFSNAVQERSAVDIVPQMKEMMENVIKHMDYDACLFMLDTAGGSMVQKVMAVTKGRSSCKYQLSLHKEYSLPIKALLKMEEATGFKRFFQNAKLIPTRISKVSSAMWLKKPLADQNKPLADQKKPLADRKMPTAVRKKKGSKVAKNNGNSCN